MNMVVIIRWVLKQHFVGHPKPEDFDLVEEELPALQDRQFRFPQKISISPKKKSSGFTPYSSLLIRTCGLTQPGTFHYMTRGHLHHQDEATVHNDWEQRCRGGGEQAPGLPRGQDHRPHGRLGRARHR